MVDVIDMGAGLGFKHGSTGMKVLRSAMGRGMTRPKYRYGGTKKKPKMRPYSPYDLSGIDEEVEKMEKVAFAKRKKRGRTRKA